MHSTNNIDDGYMGSGTRLRYSFKKHGKTNHIKEIIEYCENREELAKREKDIVTKELIQEELCINLTIGGLGAGFMDNDHMMKCSKAGNDAFKNKLKNDPDFKEKITETSRKNVFKQILNGKRNPISEMGRCDWTGRNHKESTKILIGEKNSINQKGENNSQFGTYWVNKENTNKKIKSTELDYHLKNGWVRGTKSNINGELVKNSKLTNDDVIKIKQRLFELNLSNREIAEEFKVAPQTIDKIKKGITWSHITI